MRAQTKKARTVRTKWSVMVGRILLLLFLFCVCNLSVPGLGRSQLLTPNDHRPLLQAFSTPKRAEEVAARKRALADQLASLEQAKISPEELAKARAPLEHMVRMLTALETAWQHQLTYTQKLHTLPQQLQKAQVELQRLGKRQPARFADVDELLRDQYATKLQEARTAIQTLNSEVSTGDVRLVALNKDIEQLSHERPKLLKAVTAAREHASTATVQEGVSALAELERLEVELLLLDTEGEALEAERQWLTKRGPLYDALLSLAQLRRHRAQEALETITQTLRTAIAQEQTALSSSAEELTRRLQQTTDPVESLLLAIELETLPIRQSTTEYKQQLHEVSNAVLEQEKRNAHEKQEVERLTTLVKKYASGEGVARRLLVAFERLRREKTHLRDTSDKAPEEALHRLTEQMFMLDDHLYEFDRHADIRIATLAKHLTAHEPAVKLREAALAKVREAFATKKTALREQQLVLTPLIQDQENLLSLFRERSRLIEDNYRAVLAQMFWLRDGEKMSLSVVRSIVNGAIRNAARARNFVRAERQRLWAILVDTVPLWFLLPLVVLVLPWCAIKLSAYMRKVLRSALAESLYAHRPIKIHLALLLIVRSSLWPLYLLLLAWLYSQWLPHDATRPTAMAHVSALRIIALIFWIWLVGRTVFRSNGWGQQVWNLTPEVCRAVLSILCAGCCAAFLFLVPRHILLLTPGDVETTTSSLALARLLLLAFLIVVLALTSLAARRTSSLMEVVLAQSRESEGLLWRIWPFVYLGLLAGILGIMTLDLLGYRYAARFVGLKVLGSLSVVLVLRLLLVMLVLRAVHSIVVTVLRWSRPTQRTEMDTEDMVNRYFDLVYLVCNVLLTLLGISLVLEIWGISTTWLLTSPLGKKIVTRAVFILLTVGVAAIIIQVSKVLTDYMVQPRTSHGVTREVGRKLKTMGPLIQTLLKVSVLFTAVLVILEQLSVATGPLLTGVGIFGLAVGFASQSLIKDVINGLFILFEDSLSVGDVVTLRDTTGVVEKVTLRAVTIRDLSGNVHIIPNSTFDMITNKTKDYSRYVLDLLVAYREDTDAVIELLREIDTDVRQDPDYRWDLLEPLEIMGVQALENSGVVIRARLKTRPAQQWRLGREYQRRIKKVFDEHGIQIPFPHRTLYWGSPENGPRSLHPLSDAHQASPPQDD